MSDPKTTGGERRLCRRARPRGRVRVSCRKGPLDLGPNLAAGLLDVSESGARLALREALRPGQEVTVGLLGPGQQTVRVLGVVAWALPDADGGCVAGLRFERRLSYQDLQHLT
jgi:hypothetical protein